MSSSHPTTIVLDPDIIDDILYFARTNSITDLTDVLSTTATSAAILQAAIDPDTGNSALHMASANGHTETLTHLLSLHSPPTALLNFPNISSNTPLHYAALNGHFEAVKLLLAAGADPTIVNKAGHDAVYEAEVNGKDEVARFILEKGIGLERGVGGKGEAEAEGKAIGMEEGEGLMENEGGEDEAGEVEGGVEEGMGGLHLRGGGERGEEDGKRKP